MRPLHRRKSVKRTVEEALNKKKVDKHRQNKLDKDKISLIIRKIAMNLFVPFVRISIIAQLTKL